MKRRLFNISVFLLSVLAFHPLKSQMEVSQKWEFGFWIGASNYLGDIRVSPSNVHTLFQPAGGVYNRLNFNPRLALKTGISFGTVHARDEHSDYIFEQTRNLSFRSNILEAATQLEFNFSPYRPGSDNEYITPYFFIGVGVFLFNPQAELNGTWIDLQPLGTEGQNFSTVSGNDPYSTVQVVVPVGGGIKWSIGKNLTFGFEVGYRKTFTDYVDDISTVYFDPAILATGPNGATAVALADRSLEVTNEPLGVPGRQRGDTQRNDAYIFSGISISYTFRDLMCPWPSKAGFKK